MKEAIGIIICLWLLYQYYCYMQDVENWRRQQRYPQVTKRKRKPQFLNRNKK